MTTRRDFDRATKENWGSKCMVSDERHAYRVARLLPAYGCPAAGPVGLTASDWIASRAAAMARTNAYYFRVVAVGAVPRDPFIPTLGVMSRFRAGARYRAAAGLPMLERSC